MFGGRGQPPVKVASPSSLVLVRNDQGDEKGWRGSAGMHRRDSSRRLMAAGLLM